MNKTIAIFGESAVGKSTVAERVADLLEIQLRSCGEEVKEMAKKLGVDSLLPEHHQIIDDETRHIARDSERAIVIEGRYLNKVLEAIPSVCLVELKCEDLIRKQRAENRESGGAASLKSRDMETATSRAERYASASSNGIHLTIDSSDLTAEETALLIVAHARRQRITSQ